MLISGEKRSASPSKSKQQKAKDDPASNSVDEAAELRATDSSSTFDLNLDLENATEERKMLK